MFQGSDVLDKSYEWSPRFGAIAGPCIVETSFSAIFCNMCHVIRYGVMQLDIMLCYAMLCYAMLCYAMLCYAMLCYAMLCYFCYATLLCYAILYNAVW